VVPVPSVRPACEPAVDAGATAARTVTSSQVTRAAMQLRERRGRSPVEQMQAVLRALDLTVVPDPVVPAARREFPETAPEPRARS
jgi:NAD(P)H-dependent FMN reductase